VPEDKAVSTVADVFLNGMLAPGADQR